MLISSLSLTVHMTADTLRAAPARLGRWTSKASCRWSLLALLLSHGTTAMSSGCIIHLPPGLFLSIFKASTHNMQTTTSQIDNLWDILEHPQDVPAGHEPSTEIYESLSVTGCVGRLLYLFAVICFMFASFYMKIRMRLHILYLWLPTNFSGGLRLANTVFGNLHNSS